MSRKKPVKRARKPVKGRQKRSVFAYPLFIFLLLCTGVLLIAWTFKTGAANINVTAKVSDSFVTDPAVITAPTEGSRFTSIPIDVHGTCPTSPSYTAAYVKIYDNDVFRGSAICDGSAEFSLSIDLFPDENSLTAHIFNSTDDEGPVSTAVTVFYDVPQPPPQTPPSEPATPNSPKPSNPANPPIIKTTFVYKGYHVGDQIEWPIEITGGSPPYAVSVDWGDGNADLISRPQAGEFKISHIYSQSGGFKNSYTIKVKVTDAAGGTGFMQFFVIVAPENIQQSGNIFNKPIPKLGSGLNWLWVAWPAYLLVTLMAISYKLGEREELLILRKRGRLRR